MRFNGKNEEYFEVSAVTQFNADAIQTSQESQLTLVWFQSDDNQLIIDSIDHNFNNNTIIFLTNFHKVEVVKLNKAKLLRFNSPFYCILDHDSEVGCKGVLFYGAANLPIIEISDENLDTISTVWDFITKEMNSRDNLQLEMLQMMLKRLLILSTRLFKEQNHFENLDLQNIDIIRAFNFLVEQHFKEKHNVSEYADLLNKSPKTLSNVFKKMGEKTPLQYIHERIILEARRLLRYTDKTISEVGYDLGFKDVQTFSRFFKKKESHSPNEFRNAA